MTTVSPSPTLPATEAALAAAVSTIRRNIAAFEGVYPDDSTTNGRYLLRPAGNGIAEGGNHGWTAGFWPGMQWIAWELTGDEAFRASAHAYTVDFARRVRACEDLDMHDIGFLYSLTSVAEWRLAGDTDARDAALLAADTLMRRFLEPAGIIQAWGDLDDPEQQGRTIIDSLMNLPLLTWAAEQTGDGRYSDVVRRHTAQLRQHIVRANNSTFHTFYWDLETGEPLRGATAQGAHDGSCWSRGQAWGVYGFALNYRATADQRDLDAAWRCADYFLAHLPSNLVPYWDLDFTDGDEEPLDSSAGAITVCGLLELAEVDPDPGRAERAMRAAHALLSALTEFCAPERPEDSDALLLHGVYSLPHGSGIDEGNLWGDYFYLEALARVTRPGWKTPW